MKGFFLIFFLFCVLLASCSDKLPLGQVNGKVTYQGVTVSEGSVVFTDESQGLSFVCDLDIEGHFVFQVAKGYGLPPGTYSVAIRPPRPNKPSLEFVSPNYNAKTFCSNIPKKYHENKSSGISVVVKTGVNELYVFDMK